MAGGGGGGRGQAPHTLSKAHFSCVYSAYLLMKESSFSGTMTLRGRGGRQAGMGGEGLHRESGCGSGTRGTGQDRKRYGGCGSGGRGASSCGGQDTAGWGATAGDRGTDPHLSVSTGLGSKLPSASTDAFFSVLEE